jgi:hypothetical protein
MKITCMNLVIFSFFSPHFWWMKTSKITYFSIFYFKIFGYIYIASEKKAEP